MSITSFQNIALIYNPAAGTVQRHPRAIQAVRRRLEEGGASVTLLPTSGPGSAVALARHGVQQGVDAVLVMGGDGTINEAVNGMARSPVPLGILPGGTANVVAMEVGIGGNPVRAVSYLQDAEPVRISLGYLEPDDQEPRFFLAMAGVGLDADLVARVPAQLKRRLGKAAYWIGGFSHVFRRLDVFDTHSNGSRLPNSFTLVSRVRNYGGDLEIARGASLLDDHFEAVVFEGELGVRYLLYLGGILTGTLPRCSGVSVLRTRQLQFAPNGSQRAVRVQLDGESAGFLPARVELVPDALTMLLPRSYLERERRRAWTTSPIASPA